MIKGKKSPTSVIGNIATYIAIFLPAAFGFLYVHLFGVNIFFVDGWQLVPFLQKLHSGTLDISDLFDQHLEHRYFFPRIAMLLLGSVTEYNTVPQMHLSLVFFIVTLAGIYFVFRDSLGHQPLLVLPLFIPVSFLVFSLRQSGNMLWGLQVTYAFAQAFTILAFCFLYFSGRGNTFGNLRFSAPLASATIATFSTVQGLLVWSVWAFCNFFYPYRKVGKEASDWGLEFSRSGRVDSLLP